MTNSRSSANATGQQLGIIAVLEHFFGYLGKLGAERGPSRSGARGAEKNGRCKAGRVPLREGGAQ
ncbi:hypothetical protein ACQUJS_14160 [Ralstonia pseudosolanacearum]|nr:hypothetical protein RSP799_11480 [Ralstonia solanacearum]